MGRQLFRTQYKHRLVSAGADEVIGAMPIPAGGTLKNVWGDVHIHSTTNPDRDDAAGYSVRGALIPEMNDAGGVSLDTFWDEQVPKDVALDVTAASQEIDDTPETADATGFQEPGEPNWNKVFNVVNSVQMIYNREKLMTIGSQGLFEPVASSEVDLWMPNDNFKIRIRQNYKVEMPTYVMFAFNPPAWDATTVTNEATLSAVERNLYQNLSVAMDLALPEVLGLTEGGAESPYAEVATLIGKLVEPIVEEEAGGSFAAVVYHCYSRFTFEIELPTQGRNKPISG